MGDKPSFFHSALEAAPLKVQNASLNSEISIISPFLLQFCSVQYFIRENECHHELGRAFPAGAESVQPYDQTWQDKAEWNKMNCTNIAIITLAQAPNPFQLQAQPGISLLKQFMEKQAIYFSLAVKSPSFLKQKAIFAFKEVKKKFHGKLAFLFK